MLNNVAKALERTPGFAVQFSAHGPPSLNPRPPSEFHLLPTMSTPRKSPRRTVKPATPSRTRSAAASRTAPRGSIFNLKIEEIERRLAAGEVDAEMELYFGPQLPEMLSLARAAQSTTRGTRGVRPKALGRAGIMGSQ